MEYSYLTKKLDIGILDEILKRLWIYAPLILNIIYLRKGYSPVFLESRIDSWLPQIRLDTMAEPISIICFILALVTFQQQYKFRAVMVDKEKQRIEIKFKGVVPAAFMVVLNLIKILIYFLIRNDQNQSRVKNKYLDSGLILGASSLASLLFSLFYTLRLGKDRLMYYIKLCSLWKSFHSFTVVFSFIFVSFFHINESIRIIFLITFLIISFFLFRNLLFREKTFIKLYFVNDVVNLKVLFLILTTFLYFEGYKLIEFLLKKKSIEIHFADKISNDYGESLFLFLLCCRHPFYFNLFVLTNNMIYGNIHNHILLEVGFHKREGSVIRYNSQFYYYFMERILTIMKINSKEIYKEGNVKKGYIKDMIEESQDLKDKFINYMKTRFGKDEVAKEYHSLGFKDKVVQVVCHNPERKRNAGLLL